MSTEAPRMAATGVVAQERRGAAPRTPQWYAADNHLHERRRMITNIARLLQARKPNAPADWMQKLPQMARRLEESLFRTAESFEKYKDTQTLKKRLQSLAMAMGLRAQQQKAMNERGEQQDGGSSGQGPTPQQQQQHGGPPSSVSALMPGQQQQQQYASAVRTSNGTAPAVAPNQQQPPQMVNINVSVPTDQYSRGVPHVVANTPGVRPNQQQPGGAAPRYLDGTPQVSVNLNGYGQQHGVKVEQHQTSAGQGGMTNNKAGPFGEQSVAQGVGGQQQVRVSASAQQGANGQQQQQAMAPGQQSLQPMGNAPQTAQQQRQFQRQHVLRQQQQRLLLLRHASKCPYENGSCTVTPLCARMKELWKHIAHCKDQTCHTPHCVSSRYVLAHYHRCKDPRCAVCGPVRAAIQRAAERARGERQGVRSANRPGGNAEQPTTGITLDASSSLRRGRGANGQVGQSGSIGLAGSLGGSRADQKKRLPGGGPPLAVSAAGMIVQPGSQSRGQQQHPGLPAPHRSTATDRIEDSTSLLNSFSPPQVKAHLESLKTSLRLTATKIRQKVSPLLKKLTSHENAWIFAKPVDPVELNLPDYFDVIKKPMDLGTIQKRLDSNSYKVISDLGDDVRLTFDNAILYNGPSSEVGMIARDMKVIFEKYYHQLIQSMDAEETHNKDAGEACVLCGGAKLLFEPQVYHCNGTTCGGVRIRRNAYYFTGGRNQYHWCQQCYDKLKDKERLEMPDLTLMKKDLTKKKNDESPEESWVECSKCNRWVHQICALFNGRMNKGSTPYHCPDCVTRLRSLNPPREAPVKPLGAKDIKHTSLSRFIEERVEKALSDAYAEARATPGTPCDVAPTVFVRQVSNLDQVHHVKSGMIAKYPDYPKEFPARSKCVLLFQEIDGVDVILFGMYLYEYGHDSPQPNQRRVYVSYLDSVHYFRPRKYRTMVYHEMLIAYLADVKQRGFHTAHIWACPPCKGDDYIFFCHPEDQKTPKDDRLRQWYISLLKKAKTEGIVTHITNLWDEHFKADKSATLVPYFEGDYWPGEAENVIKQIEDEAAGRGEPKAKKDKKASALVDNTKIKSERGGLRSDGLEDENGQDSLVARMGKILQPMKESFIVAYLHPREFARVMSERPKSSEKAPASAEKKEVVDKKPPAPAKKAAAPAPAAAEEMTTTTAEAAAAPAAATAAAPAAADPGLTVVKAEETPAAEPTAMEVDVKPEKDAGEETKQAEEPEVVKVKEEEEKKEDETSKEVEEVAESAEAPAPAAAADPAAVAEQPAPAPAPDADVAMAPAPPADAVKTEDAPSTDAAAPPKVEEAAPSSAPAAAAPAPADSAKPVAAAAPAPDAEAPAPAPVPATPKILADETRDSDEIIESDFYDTRQLFLNLCQGNHYQFDELRRAKHTSMMALYHMHNPEVPKFTTVCSHCQQDINAGNFWTSEKDQNFSLCENCYRTQKNMFHDKQPFRVTSVGGGEAKEEQRPDRQRLIQLHMELVEHTYGCKDPNCTFPNCAKMKLLLNHPKTCTINSQGNGQGGSCDTCRRVWALLKIYARHRRKDHGTIPPQLKEHLRTIQQQSRAQQAQMDERRRNAMNAAYARGQ